MTKRYYPFENCMTIQQQRKVHIGSKEVDMGIASEWRMPLVYDKTVTLLFEGLHTANSKTRRTTVNAVSAVTQTEVDDHCDASVHGTHRHPSRRVAQIHNYRQMHFNSVGQLSRADYVPPLTKPCLANSQLQGTCELCTKSNLVLQSRCHFCEKFSCNACVQMCHRCHNAFCSLCSIKVYDMKDEVNVCLSCS